MKSTEEAKQELELEQQFKKIKWPIDYGNIKIQLRAGKPTLITIEKTIRLD